MRIGMIGVAALALALVGCSGDAPDHEPTANSAVAESTTNAQQAVIALPDAARNGVLFRAISDAGLPCQQVVSSERLPDEGAAPAWRATCENGTSHMIRVQSDGIAHVLSPRGQAGGG